MDPIFFADDISHAALRVLNRAFCADSEAIQKLVLHRPTCNEALADDPTVVVHSSPNGCLSVSMMGIINGILSELNVRRIAWQTDEEIDAPVETIVVKGFVLYG